MTTSCVLWSSWSTIWLIDKIIFKHIHVRALARISVPAADHSLMIRYSGIAGEVDIWTHAWGIYEMKSVTFHVSLNWHPNTVWAPLTNDLAGNGPECKISIAQTSLSLEYYSSISRPMIVRDRVPSHPRGNPQYPPIENITTGLTEEHKRDPPSLPYNCGHHKAAGTCPRQHTTSQNSKSVSACSYPPVENPLEITQFHSPLKLLWFGWIALWFQLLTCIFRRQGL